MTEIEMSISDMTVYLTAEKSSSSSAVYSAGICAGGYVSDECGGRYAVDCWGDGIFSGYGCTTSTPEILKSLIGESYTVNNYGQYGETAEAVAFRQGAIYAKVSPFTVGEDINEPTPITYRAPDGDSLSTLSDDGDYLGDNYVYIDGEKYMFRKAYGGDGKLYALSADVLSKEYSDMSYMRAEGCGVNHTAIICVGFSGWVNSDPTALIGVINNMIRCNGNNNYIVVSPPIGSYSSMKETEQLMGAEFGKRFFNSRAYLSSYGLSDNSLTATDDDSTAILAGKIPPSLLNGDGYGNEYFHTSLAKGIYRLGLFLGLWS